MVMVVVVLPVLPRSPVGGRISLGGATRKNVEWDMRVCMNITISIVERRSNTTVAIGLAINDGLVWSGNLATLKWHALRKHCYGNKTADVRSNKNENR